VFTFGQWFSDVTEQYVLVRRNELVGSADFGLFELATSCGRCHNDLFDPLFTHG